MGKKVIKHYHSRAKSEYNKFVSDNWQNVDGTPQNKIVELARMWRERKEGGRKEGKRERGRKEGKEEQGRKEERGRKEELDEHGYL